MGKKSSFSANQDEIQINKTLKVNPVSFFIGFVLISLLTAFILGGYSIGKNDATKKQDSRISVEEQIKLDPITLPENPEKWITYKFEPLNMEIKLPEKINKLADWKVTELKGNSGSLVCLSDKINKNENECLGEILTVGSTSNDFSTKRNYAFTDAQGFSNENGIYFVKYPNENHALKDVKFKLFENNENYKIIKILGKNDGNAGLSFASLGTPGNDYLGAIVNTNNPKFPGLVFKIKIDDEISEYEFDQILRSLKPIN